ncbi:unnamed protein product [Effrenium voratum]|nr:unnamed protein product [Effrenium voratum]
MEWSGPRSYRSLLEALRQEEELERQLEQAESAELRAQIFSEAHAQAAAEESAAALEMYLQAARDKAADAWAKHEEPLQRAAVQLARARRGAAVLEEEHADRWQQQEKLLWLQQEVAQMDLHDKASILSSYWLLRVCSPVSNLLSSRQLWHLGLADFVHASIQLAFSQIPHDFLFLPPPSLALACSARAAIHFCLITL